MGELARFAAGVGRDGEDLAVDNERDPRPNPQRRYGIFVCLPPFLTAPPPPDAIGLVPGAQAAAMRPIVVSVESRRNRRRVAL